MNDQQFAEQQARVQKYIDKWLKPMGLGYWDLSFKWFRGPFIDGNGVYNKNRLACVAVDWRYLHGSISFDLIAVAECTDEFLERAVVHELVHVITQELQVNDSSWQAQWEWVTEMLAKAFMWTNELVPRPMASEEVTGDGGSATPGPSTPTPA